MQFAGVSFRSEAVFKITYKYSNCVQRNSFTISVYPKGFVDYWHSGPLKSSPFPSDQIEYGDQWAPYQIYCIENSKKKKPQATGKWYNQRYFWMSDF